MSATASALRRRGVPQLTATLAAELGVLAFRTAFATWVEDTDGHTFGALAREALAELHAAQATMT